MKKNLNEDCVENERYGRNLFIFVVRICKNINKGNVEFELKNVL